MTVFLTSAGFENPKIGYTFLQSLSKKPDMVKALFIPTAAIHPCAIAVLPKCMNDLLNCGIDQDNIQVFDFHCTLTTDYLNAFDVVYCCGGDTQYLLDRINSTDSKENILHFINRNGIFVGVSAGSLIASNNYANNLGLINCRLNVHCKNGSPSGKIKIASDMEILLTDKQAIFIHDNEYEILGL